MEAQEGGECSIVGPFKCHRCCLMTVVFQKNTPIYNMGAGLCLSSPNGLRGTEVGLSICSGTHEKMAWDFVTAPLGAQ